LLLAGIALVVSPWLAGTIQDHPLGTWRVYEDSTGFTAAQSQLAAADAPVAVSVEMTTSGISTLPRGVAILTMTASVEGRTVLAGALDFAGSVGRDSNPQTQEKIFRADAGVIDPVETGSYTFTLANGDAEGVTVRAVDLVLTQGGARVDKRLQPLGFSLAAVGFIGLVLAFRHRGGTTPSNPNSQPPPPRWGRGA